MGTSSQLWDLSSKTLLTTVNFPKPISCLAWDVTERLFFAASADGSIHQMNLFRVREDKFGRAVTEAVGGTGISDVIRINDDDQDATRKRLISVGYYDTALLRCNAFSPTSPANQSRHWLFPSHPR